MLKINYQFEKEAINKKSKETLLLVELNGEKIKSNKILKPKKLNISISIDISGSMNEVVKRSEPSSIPIFNQPSINPLPFTPGNPWVPNPFFPIDPYQTQPFNDNGGLPNPNPNQTQPQDMKKMFEQYQNSLKATEKTILSKLEQAKNVAIEAINNLKEGDIVSITAFDDNAHIIVPAITISNNKAEIIQKIKQLTTKGSTNLHGGWLASSLEVAKNLSHHSINRVLILTDGQTNRGIVNPKEIISNVAALYEKEITTSTFGIGQGFNEDLLQDMANAGNGNFYYIDDENKMSQMFKEEFSGLSNLIATDIEINYTHMKAKQIGQLNNFIEKDKSIKVPNVLSHKKQSLLLKLELDIPKNTKHIELGELNIVFKDEQGNKCHQSIALSSKICSEKEWKELPFNQEVKVQETLLVVANNKIAATKALDLGDYEGARSMLSGSMAYINQTSLSDNRLANEINELSVTLNNSNHTNINSLRKEISYQSYKTRFNKN